MSEPNAPQRGSYRAAVLLMSLGEAGAAQVLRHIDAQEVRQVGQAMTELSNVSREQVDEVLKLFLDEVKGQTALGIGSEQYLRDVLDRALGSERAQSVIEPILQGRNTKGLEALKWMEPRGVVEILKREHPQVIAVVLAHLSRERSAQVLGLLPEAQHADIVMRVANLGSLPRDALNDLDEIMEQRIADSSGEQLAQLGGTKVAADIVNKLGPDGVTTVIDRIRELDDELGLKIKDMMFVFESLLEVDDRGIQLVLREVSSDRLVVALKGADASMRDKVFNNMSNRASDILKDDMEAKGPVRLSDVEEAQKEILEAALRLAEDGKLQLGGSGEEYV